MERDDLKELLDEVVSDAKGIAYDEEGMGGASSRKALAEDLAKVMEVFDAMQARFASFERHDFVQLLDDVVSDAKGVARDEEGMGGASSRKALEEDLAIVMNVFDAMKALDKEL